QPSVYNCSSARSRTVEFCVCVGCPASCGISRCFFFSSRRRHTRSVSAFLLNRSSDLWFHGKVRPNHETNINIIARRTGKDVNSRSEERRVGKECRSQRETCWWRKDGDSKRKTKRRENRYGQKKAGRIHNTRSLANGRP